MLTNGEYSSDTPHSDSRPSNESRRRSSDSITSASTTSLALENINGIPLVGKPREPLAYRDNDSDPELPRYLGPKHTTGHGMSPNVKRLIWAVSIIAASGWALALFMFMVTGRYKHASQIEYDHTAPKTGSGKKITLEQIHSGQWTTKYADVSWVPGPNGEDGLLLETAQLPKDFLVVEDIRGRSPEYAGKFESKTLMKSGWFTWDGQQRYAEEYWVAPDMKSVLVMTAKEKVFRHSFTGLYFIVDVATQNIEPLDPQNPDKRVQLATWSPTSESIVFTRDNNLFLRMTDSQAVRQITTDGGPEYFYGVPDWTYEEEVFMTNAATWWSRDGKFVAFLRTNETMVPSYPVQFFIKRPSGTDVDPGLEAYPEVTEIKYPKAGAPNPVVDMLFYDVSRNEEFTVDTEGGFPDDNRLITNAVWADNGKVLIQEANRESDHIRYVLFDVIARNGKTVRVVDLTAVDGGWVEPGQRVTYIPADPSNGRPYDGYIDTTVYEDNDHLAYYTPVDNDKPIMLTKGNWEIDPSQAPASVDLKNNLVYFTSTKMGPSQRHLYSVTLNGTDLTAITPESETGYWTSDFSDQAGYINLFYSGPSIPSQKVISAPVKHANFEIMLEDNQDLAKMAKEHELPHLIYSNVSIDGYTIPVVERRPPHFDPNHKYPVLFYLYGGPGNQQVTQKFHIDFQSYIAANLGYIVVTVDGRGTGFIGRKARTIIREHFGKWEAHDQISTAKIWQKKPYVDADRMAIWGWSYGGFMTLKVLETDAGQTFKYGMAVAPVTDWRFYDSIYTERYMRMPQNNPAGYAESAISNVTALSQNVRFLIMHGVADDNVHLQNTLTLLDKLDLKGVDNYDVHFFPDSDHSIYFHNANFMVYEKLAKWVTNAFNGVWYETEEPRPEG